MTGVVLESSRKAAMIYDLVLAPRMTPAPSHYTRGVCARSVFAGSINQCQDTARTTTGILVPSLSEYVIFPLENHTRRKQNGNIGVPPPSLVLHVMSKVVGPLYQPWGQDTVP